MPHSTTDIQIDPMNGRVTVNGDYVGRVFQLTYRVSEEQTAETWFAVDSGEAVIGEVGTNVGVQTQADAITRVLQQAMVQS